MKENQLDPQKRIEVLTALLNTTISVPKFTEVKVKGKVEQIPTGSYELSPFSDEELLMLKALIFMDLQDHVDCGRLAEAQEKRKSEIAKLDAVLKAAEKAEQQEVVPNPAI